MSANILPWLDDGALSKLAGDGVADRGMWAHKYDPTCPSEFYRGYSTVLSRIDDGFRSNANIAMLGRLINAADVAVKALPADERRDGASFALANVAGYLRGATVQQLAMTLSAELVCIARCFVQNKARGI